MEFTRRLTNNEKSKLTKEELKQYTDWLLAQLKNQSKKQIVKTKQIYDTANNNGVQLDWNNNTGNTVVLKKSKNINNNNTKYVNQDTMPQEKKTLTTNGVNYVYDDYISEWVKEGTETKPEAFTYTGKDNTTYLPKINLGDVINKNTGELVGNINTLIVQGKEGQIPKLLKGKDNIFGIYDTSGNILTVPKGIENIKKDIKKGGGEDIKAIPLSQLPDEFKQLRMAMVAGKNPNVNVKLPQASDLGGSFLNSILKGASEGALNVLGNKISQETGKYKFDREIVPQLEQTYGTRFQNKDEQLSELKKQQDELAKQTGQDYFGLRKLQQENVAKQIGDINNPQYQYSSAGLMPGQQNNLAYQEALQELGVKIRAKELRDSAAVQLWVQEQMIKRGLTQQQAATASETGNMLLSYIAGQQPATNSTTTQTNNTVAK